MSAPPASDRAAPVLATALDKNKEATEEVQAIADELAVTHAVLTKSGLGARTSDVEEAIARTGDAEKQLNDVAQKLDEVNELLEREAVTPPKSPPRP